MPSTSTRPLLTTSLIVCVALDEKVIAYARFRYFVVELVRVSVVFSVPSTYTLTLPRVEARVVTKANDRPLTLKLADAPAVDEYFTLEPL